ncbi:hypothetical protein NUW58_g10501 [Xylaria curta]|uniref:Uncharacterized protein n=1 Tax=Xylaria curta TaxID=42375 RepID=A0ACC1MKA0_9PEZI|nr:hypothetical protein NUW58_g10501 [Xylaria curta]
MAVEIVTIVNSSGKIISNGKHLVSAFKEAKAAYEEKKRKGRKQEEQITPHNPMASFAPSPTSSTMAQTSSPKPGGSKQTTTTTAAAAAATSTFTPEMQDRQARGKNPYSLASDDSDEATMDDGSGRESGGNARPRRHGAPKRRERFAVHDRRRMAAQILDSPELLMMAAVRDDEVSPFPFIGILLPPLRGDIALSDYST